MKLHLGCGKRYIPGYAHIDIVPFPHIDIAHSVDDLPMIANNSVEVVYNCHILEHFHRKSVDRVLKEWHRILIPGGTLRISVPDFEAIVEIYKKAGMDAVIGPLFGRQDYLYNIHFHVFDFASLSKFLTEAGFKNIKKYDWKTTEHADIDDYSKAYWPHMDQSGILVSLNVEATK